MAETRRGVFPPAHLAIRAFASCDGPGIAAAWLDDEFLSPHLLVVALRHCQTTWLLPHGGLWPERLAVALSDVLAIAVDAPASVALLPMSDHSVEVAVQLHPVVLPADPLDAAAVGPVEWTVFVLDHGRPAASVLRHTLRTFVARLRGAAVPPDAEAPGDVAPADIAVSVVGVAVAAELVQRLSNEPESPVHASRLAAAVGHRSSDLHRSRLL
jgi:hypothetical protein